MMRLTPNERLRQIRNEGHDVLSLWKSSLTNEYGKAVAENLMLLTEHKALVINGKSRYK